MIGSIQWALARVLGVESIRPGLQELVCCLMDGTAVNAVAYTDLIGMLEAGQSVWLNLRAISLGLGTGGVAFVVAPADPAADGSYQPLAAVGYAAPATRTVDSGSSQLPQAEERSGTDHSGAEPGNADCSGADQDSGYLVKARYTPLQVAVQGVDSQRSVYHQSLARAESLERMPVVVADLHSSLPAICAAIRHDAAQFGQQLPRLVYVMTDGAALPLAFSRTVARLRRDGSLAATITAGQAFGGDFEAVSVHSALLAARQALSAQIVICIQGPGNLGTDTRYGFSGVAVGDCVNAISVLGGQPVGCLRLSAVDRRARHRFLSHHSLTAYGKVALRPAKLALPVFDGRWAAFGGQVRAAAEPLAGLHELIDVPLDGLAACLAAEEGLSTMGRAYQDDPPAFLAAAAAGRLALGLIRNQAEEQDAGQLGA